MAGVGRGESVLESDAGVWVGREPDGLDECCRHGSNRGIGQALVEEALRRGAKRVYAGRRQPLGHPDPRVRSVTLDVADQSQIDAAVETVDSLDVLINNAGVALYDDLSDRAALEQSLSLG